MVYIELVSALRVNLQIKQNKNYYSRASLLTL